MGIGSGFPWFGAGGFGPLSGGWAIFPCIALERSGDLHPLAARYQPIPEDRARGLDPSDVSRVGRDVSSSANHAGRRAALRAQSALQAHGSRDTHGALA